MTITEPVTIPKIASPAPLRRKKFTRQEVDCLLTTDVFVGQRYELIDGDLIDKMGQSAPHAAGIQRTSKWFRRFLPDDRVRVQLPVELIGEHRDLSVPSRTSPFWPNSSRSTTGGILGATNCGWPSRSPIRWRGSIPAAKRRFTRLRVCQSIWVLDLNRRALVVHRQSDGTQYNLIRLFSENQTASMDGRSETVQVSELLPERAEENAGEGKSAR